MPEAYSFKKILKDSYGTLLITALVGLAAGYLLEEHIPRHVAIFLIMVPPLNDMGGNIGGVLGARISSALHLGTITPKFRDQQALAANVLASGILGLISFLAIGFGFFFIEYWVFSGSLLMSTQMMLIFFGSGLLLTLILIGITVVSAFIAYKNEIDPDNVVMPIVTTAGDIGGISSLLLMTHLAGI